MPEFRENVGLPPFPADPPILSETGAVCELFLTEIPMPEIPPGSRPEVRDRARVRRGAEGDRRAAARNRGAAAARARALRRLLPQLPAARLPRERGLPLPAPAIYAPVARSARLRRVRRRAGNLRGGARMGVGFPPAGKNPDSVGGAARAALRFDRFPFFGFPRFPKRSTQKPQN